MEYQHKQPAKAPLTWEYVSRTESSTSKLTSWAKGQHLQPAKPPLHIVLGSWTIEGEGGGGDQHLLRSLLAC